MTIRNVTEAKAELSKLLVLAEQGEEIIIARAGKPVVRLQLIEPKPATRKLGVLKDTWKLPNNFDEIFVSMDKEIEESFYGGEVFP